MVDIPDDVASALGGLKQMRVRGVVNGAEFASNTMPAGNRRLALSMSQKLLAAAGASVGDAVSVEIETA